MPTFLSALGQSFSRLFPLTASEAAITGFAVGGEEIGEEYLLRAAMDGSHPTAGNTHAQFLADRERSEKIGELRAASEAAESLRQITKGISDRNPRNLRALRKNAREIGSVLTGQSAGRVSEITYALQIPTRRAISYALVLREGAMTFVGAADAGERLLHNGDTVLASGLLLREEGRLRIKGDPYLEMNDDLHDPQTGWIHFTLDKTFFENREVFHRALQAMRDLSAKICEEGFARYRPLFQTEDSLRKRTHAAADAQTESANWAMEHFDHDRLLAYPQLLNPWPGRLTELVLRKYNPNPADWIEALRCSERRLLAPYPLYFALIERTDGELELRGKAAIWDRRPEGRWKGFGETTLAEGILFAGEEPGVFQYSVYQPRKPDAETLGRITDHIESLGVDAFPLVDEFVRVVGRVPG